VSRSDNAVNAKLHEAARGPRSGAKAKIAQIAAYIMRVANEEYEGNFEAVECPDDHEWDGLASGRNPLLPTATQLTLCSNDKLNSLTDKYGGIRQVFFAAAKQQLRRERR
jgi:hypothetical protein